MALHALSLPSSLASLSPLLLGPLHFSQMESESFEGTTFFHLQVFAHAIPSAWDILIPLPLYLLTFCLPELSYL